MAKKTQKVALQSKAPNGTRNDGVKPAARGRAQPSVAEMKGDTAWFVHDRFGIFIHWGLYSLPARHEWVREIESIPTELYDAKYFTRFDPDLYDPKAWADAASYAGMKYFVITTKHHEGFCLWDSKLTDYKVTNTPAGRDLLRPMVDAFREKNMRVGFYHSLLDWHHPHYVIDDVFGPYRYSPDREKMNVGRVQAEYAKFLRGQVRELLTQFGKVDVMWFDFSYPTGGRGKGRADWDSENLLALVRKLQPHIVLDDRLDIPYGWDVKTPEQFQPREWPTLNGQRVVWEACQTLSGSWGYHRDETSWRSTEQLIQTLIDCVSKGGNFLLNVGPTGRGEFDSRAMDRLRGIGDWMKYHSRSIYGCTQAPAEFQTPEDCRLTYNPEKKRLYLHIFAWPYKYLFLPGSIYGKRVEYAQLLNDASEIRVGLDDWHAKQAGGQEKGNLALVLPPLRPEVRVPVIEMFLKD